MEFGKLSKVRYFIDKLRQNNSITSHKTDWHTEAHTKYPYNLQLWHEYQHTPNGTPISTTNNKKQNKGKNTLKNKLYRDNFDIFWSKVNRKISKGQSQKAYNKLAEEWGSKPEALAELYNKHCSSEKMRYSLANTLQLGLMHKGLFKPRNYS